MREGAGERTGGEMAEIFDFNGAILRISANGHHMIVSLLVDERPYIASPAVAQRYS